MNANDIRLYEHIKLLQRGVELFQQQRGKSCENLANGFNGQKICIGLLGATSAGKTTLIKRLLAEAAGKVSSKPETACLVVHSFARVESLVLTFNERVEFADEAVSHEFNDFLKRFRIKDSYQQLNNLEWKLRKDENERTLDCASDKILDFFEQVNKFGEVFSKIKWNHKQRKSDYNLTDLFDIYDLPGFGGKEEHDQAVGLVFDTVKFDVLVYLIDTGRGIPGEDEMPYLRKIQKYLDEHRETVFYWAYEKESEEGVLNDEKREDIDQALEEGECLNLAKRNRGLLDLTGPEDDDCDVLRSKLLSEILKPYFEDKGQEFVNESYSSDGGEDESVKSKMGEALKANDSWLFIKEALEAVGNVGEDEGKLCSRKAARDCLIDHFFGDHQSFFKDGQSMRPNEGDADLEIARKGVGRKILSTLDKIVKAVSNFGGNVSLSKIRRFKESVFQHDMDIRTMLYDVQYYWRLSDPSGADWFIKAPMTDNLRDNIKEEVKAIKEFAPEEE